MKQKTETTGIKKDATGSLENCVTSITKDMKDKSNTDYKNRVNTTSYWARFDLKDYDKNVTVNGDGSTIINVYYTRRTYTLRIVYARSIECTDDVKEAIEKAGGTATKDEQIYQVFGDNSRYFGAGVKSTADTNLSPKKNVEESLDGDDDIDDDDYLIYNLLNTNGIYNTTYGYKRAGDGWWANVEELPKLKAEYKDKVTLGSIKITDETNTYLTATPWTYYYIEITAKYGADISDKFQGDIFEPSKVCTESLDKDTSHTKKLMRTETLCTSTPTMRA